MVVGQVLITPIVHICIHNHNHNYTHIYIAPLRGSFKGAAETLVLLATVHRVPHRKLYGKCFNCGKVGHTDRKCFQPKKVAAMSNEQK